MSWFLRQLGFKVYWVCDWGRYDTRKYDAVDYAGGRPIHPGMSVAPPWAKMKVHRKGRQR